MRAFLLVLAATTVAGVLGALSNMNGEYLIANPNTASGVKYNTNYGSNNANEYMDLYTPPIRTVYGEVYWTMMDPIPLPPAIVSRFANKTIAIVGYEVDQVYVTPQGDVSVPIYWAYNHHYGAYLMGSGAKLEKVNGTPHMAMGANHGSSSFYRIVDPAYEADPDVIPSAQFFSEGNGGECRKSYHGYPSGYAQLVLSPVELKVQPMQIDTHNRDYHGPGFRAGLLPRSSAAPPNATYSGLLECPCTTRIVKKWNTTYTTATSGLCPTPLANASECFTAAAAVGPAPSTTQTVSSAQLPSGCTLTRDAHGAVTATFNTLSTQVACGQGGTQFFGQFASFVNASLLLDTKTAGGLATITMSGPAAFWYGLGFHASAMGDMPYTIIVDGTGNVTERKLGDHDPGTQLPVTQVKVVSNKVVAGVRTVVLTRAFKGATPDHYTFDPSVTSLPMINAVGNTVQLAFHKSRGSATFSLEATDAPTCVCNGGTHGTIDGLPFNNNCAPQPIGELLEQKNPTCSIQTYQGGLSCCHHAQVLLDADQPVDSRVDEYHLKFRFWFQEYVPATPTAPASHQNLHRYYFQTEAWAGEYDVVKAPAGTPASECVQEISARFQVKDLPYCAYDPDCKVEGQGIHLLYAGGHCHAPSCISMELYNEDTGQLLCRQEPVFGSGSGQPFDEKDYIAIPPCLWGPESEGLIPPTFLSWDTHLLSIKRNNNTYTHYGEMASWQMRGVVVY